MINSINRLTPNSMAFANNKKKPPVKSIEKKVQEAVKNAKKNRGLGLNEVDLEFIKQRIIRKLK